ncbi:hypothetical protein H9P43_006621 [Blastocladiella emersonii ATCC 22665]|nr:hypothetical protein H9P43_006621 [Blastocladiella emersonii ATCC 22665]
MAPLLTDLQAISTLAVSGASLVISFVTTCYLGLKYFVTLPKWLGGKIRSARRKHTRPVLLLVYGMLLVVDSANAIYFNYTAWMGLGTHFFTTRLLYAIIYVLLLPFVANIITRRHALIIVEDRARRARFIRFMSFFSVTISIFIFLVGAMNLVKLDQLNSPALWIDTPLFPYWSLAPLSVLLTAVIGGAFWSLKVAFTEPQLERPGSGFTTSSSESLSADAKTAASASASTSNQSRANLEIQTSVRDSIMSPPPSAVSTSVTFLWPNPLLSVTSSPSTPTSPASKRGGLQLVLTRSFRTLTIILILEWFALLILVASPLPVRASSTSTFMASLMLVTEASFDWLLRQNHEREESKRRVERQKQVSHVAGMSAVPSFL